MTSTKSRYEGVQILRATLFVAIVAFHCGLVGTSLFWGGIEIFFVISAYFFTRKLIKSEYNMFFTIRDRVFRLYPTYILLLLFSFIYIFFTENVVAIKDLVIHTLFSQNINWMITGYKSELVSLTAHTWTLSIEIYAFLIYVFAFKLCKSNTSRIAFNIGSILCAIAWRTVLTVTVGDEMLTSVCPLAHLDAFAIGSLLAIIEEGRMSEKSKNIFSMAALIAGVAVIVGCISLTAALNGKSFLEAFNSYKSSENYFNHAFTSNLYIGFSLLGVGILYFLKKYSLNFAIFKPLVICGDISYSAYLIHYPICRILFKSISERWIVFACTLALTIPISFGVEKILFYLRCFIKTRKERKGEANDTVI